MTENTTFCMLIDETAIGQLLFREVLSETSMPVQCTFMKSCEDAIEYLDVKPAFVPTFVFISWDLAGVSGVDCMARLKALMDAIHAEFIIITATLPSDEDIKLMKSVKISFILKNKDLKMEAESLIRFFNQGVPDPAMVNRSAEI